MKIIITGASGLLGRRMFELLSKTEEVAGTYFGPKAENLHYLDVTDKEAVNSFFSRERPDVIIHAAAMVDVDYAEENKEEARKTNVEGTRNVVEACKKQGCKLVYLSSDFVFDGDYSPYKEESETRPVNYYGQTKLDGEKIVKENLDNYLIIRPALLYGNDEGSKPSFVSKVIETLKKGDNFHADDTIIKYPTLTDDVSEAIKKLLEMDAIGTYHVAGEEALTKYQWAKKIASQLGYDETKIISKADPGKAPRPKNVRLDNSKIKKLGIHLAAEKSENGTEMIRNQKGCMFKMIYSARQDMLVLNQNVSQFRIEVGKKLAEEQPANADMVIPIPESGIYGATGYSEKSRIPFYFGIIRDYHTNKTLFEPNIRMRNAALEKKLIVVPEIVKDKRIVIIDEAILAGTTLAVVIDKLKKAGAREIHVRIPSPPMIHRCEYKVLDKNANLIAKKFGNKKEEIEEGLRKHFEVDSLKFLSLEGFLGCLKNKDDACYACFVKKQKEKVVRLHEVPDEIREGGNYSIKRLFTEKLRKNPENIGFYQTTIPPRSVVKNHYHNELDEILYFITKGKVKTDSETHEFNPGDILILPPGSSHEIIAEENEVKLIAVKLPNIVEDKVNVN